jgi:hypothetical protein
MATITRTGSELFYKLFEHVDLPYEQWEDTKRTLSLLNRAAKRADSLAVESCNGPAWIEHRNGAPGEMDKWTEDLDKRTDRNDKRIRELVALLPHVDGQPWTVELSGDPRGYVVKLLAPTEELRRSLWNTWGGAESGFGVGQ